MMHSKNLEQPIRHAAITPNMSVNQLIDQMKKLMNIFGKPKE